MEKLMFRAVVQLETVGFIYYHFYITISQDGQISTRSHELCVDAKFFKHY